MAEERGLTKGNLFKVDKYCPQWQGVDMVSPKSGTKGEIPDTAKRKYLRQAKILVKRSQAGTRGSE
jgi:hypothetical protein